MTYGEWYFIINNIWVEISIKAETVRNVNVCQSKKFIESDSGECVYYDVRVCVMEVIYSMKENLEGGHKNKSSYHFTYVLMRVIECRLYICCC